MDESRYSLKTFKYTYAEGTSFLSRFRISVRYTILSKAAPPLQRKIQKKNQEKHVGALPKVSVEATWNG